MLQLTEAQIDQIFDKDLSLDEFMKHAPFVVVVNDSNGFLRKVNSVLCKILGKTAEELTSVPFFKLIHPQDLPKTVEAYENSPAFGFKPEVIAGFQNRYKTSDGRYALLEWFATGQAVNEHNLAIAIFRGYE